VGEQCKATDCHCNPCCVFFPESSANALFAEYIYSLDSQFTSSADKAGDQNRFAAVLCGTGRQNLTVHTFKGSFSDWLYLFNDHSYFPSQSVSFWIFRRRVTARSTPTASPRLTTATSSFCRRRANASETDLCIHYSAITGDLVECLVPREPHNGLLISIRSR
jgi:hypothetical protein